MSLLLLILFLLNTSGVKQAQVFLGGDTLVADAYPMKSGKQFVNLCVLSTQPHILCSPRWQNTPFCLNWYNPRYIYHLTLHFLSTHVLCHI